MKVKKTKKGTIKNRWKKRERKKKTSIKKVFKESIKVGVRGRTNSNQYVVILFLNTLSRKMKNFRNSLISFKLKILNTFEIVNGWNQNFSHICIILKYQAYGLKLGI